MFIRMQCVLEITQEETKICKSSCCNRCRKNVALRTEILHGLPPTRGPLFDPVATKLAYLIMQ